MAFYRNKRKQFPHKRQENTFHTPMPAGQSLTWKMHMHLVGSGGQQICKAGAAAWALVASPSPRPQHFPRERRSCCSAGVGRPHITAPWGSGCIKDFLTDAAITLSTLSRCPAALCLGGWQSTAAWQPAKLSSTPPCRTTNPADKRSAPQGSPDFGCTEGLKDHRVLMDKLNMSRQRAAAATKANRMLGCIHRDTTSRDRDAIIPLSACQVTSSMLCPVLVPTIQKRCGRTGQGPKEGHKIDRRAGEPAL